MNCQYSRAKQGSRRTRIQSTKSVTTVQDAHVGPGREDAMDHMPEHEGNPFPRRSLAGLHERMDRFFGCHLEDVDRLEAVGAPPPPIGRCLSAKVVSQRPQSPTDGSGQIDGLRRRLACASLSKAYLLGVRLARLPAAEWMQVANASISDGSRHHLRWRRSIDY